MNHQLIMLPNPILVDNKKEYHSKSGDFWYDIFLQKIQYCDSDDSVGLLRGKKIIAGIEGLPKLDLSAIAERIGWVDVEKLAITKFGDGDYAAEAKMGFRYGFKTAQSLNEKKYTLADIQEAWESGKHYGTTECEFYNTDSVSRTQYEKCETKEQFIQELSKPKEYNVVDYTQEGNTIKVIKIK